MEPTPLRPPDNRRQFLLGLGLGAIPLGVWLIFIGWATFDVMQCRRISCSSCDYAGFNQLVIGLLFFIALSVVQLVFMIVMLANQTRRFLGYGLLVMLIIGPIVGFIAATQLPEAARTAPANAPFATGDLTHAQISIQAAYPRYCDVRSG
jgi:hypothetical protein